MNTVARRRGLLVVAGVALATAGSAAAQSRECSGGMPAFGSLGIGEFKCVGGTCAINMRNGDPYAHSFSTEPRIGDLDRNGPGRGVLRDGDILVAIDGTLITTAEGGRRLGSLEPGQDVRLTLRRDGREISAWLSAEASCELPRLTVTSGTGWDATATALGYTFSATDSSFLAAWSTSDSIAGVYLQSRPFGKWAEADSLRWARPLYMFADSAGRSYGFATSPLAMSEGAALSFDATTLGDGLAFGAARAPRVEFGLELSCGDCGWRGFADAVRFATTEFPVVESVERGGPADGAGIMVGDVIIAVDGKPIASNEAGRRLGALSPGESVTLELRRGDRVVAVTLAPREASGRRQRM